MCVRVAILATVTLLAACGGGRDQRLDENRRACEALAAGVTIAEVAQRLRAAQALATECRTDWTPLRGGDGCPYAPTQEICVVALQWYTSDDRACDGGLPGGTGVCAYRCEVRTAGPPSGATPICAREFITGQ